MQRLAAHRPVAEELTELGGWLEAASPLPATPLPGLEDTPLVLHACDGIRKVLTAVGWLTTARRTPLQAGVLALPPCKTERLFVTLDKSEGSNDRIVYRDYAISTERLHWQTQNSAGPDTPAGRRYLDSASNGWRSQRYVRVRKAAPNRACGPVVLERGEGNRPMSLTWRFGAALPARLFRAFGVLREG